MATCGGAVGSVPYPFVSRVGDQVVDRSSSKRGRTPLRASSQTGKLTFKDRLGRLNTRKVTYKKEFLEKGSLVLKIREFASTFLMLCQSIRGWGKKAIYAAKTCHFTKGLAQANLPFRFLGGAVLLTNLVDDAKGLHEARKKKDGEKIRDHSLNLASGTVSLAETGLSAAINVKQVLGSCTSGLIPALSALGIVAYVAMAVGQLVGFLRSKRALAPLEKTLDPKRFTNASNEEKVEGYRRALEALYEKVTLTPKEVELLKRKTAGDEAAFELAKEKLLSKKFTKLERRVGLEVAEQIKENIPSILSGLDSTNEGIRQKSYMDAQKLLEGYKGTLYKDLVLRVSKIAIAAFGILASALMVATPVGAAIASSLIVLGVVLATLYVYRASKTWKKEDFAKGITFLGRTYNRIEVPSASKMIQEEILLKLKNKQSKHKLPKGQKTLLELCEEYAEIPVEKPPKLTVYEKFRKKAIVMQERVSDRLYQLQKWIAEAA